MTKAALLGAGGPCDDDDRDPSCLPVRSSPLQQRCWGPSSVRIRYPSRQCGHAHI
jgi:hypothetical protein